MTQLTADITSAHERSGPPTLGDLDSFPSFAELTRTLVEPGAVGALATLTHDGHPYTSIAPVSTDVTGAPIICVSELAEHTRNLRRSGRASVLVEAPTTGDVDPLSLARATFVGSFAQFEPTSEHVDRHLAAHPHAADYVGFADFGWWRMQVEQLRYVGGFGVMGWATADDLAAATPDPIIPLAGPMIEHLNEDHADACALIARRLGGASHATSAIVTDLDRYGVTFLAHGCFDDHDVATSRVAFPEPLASPEHVRAATVALVGRARVDETEASS